ncbi:hypothetical protein FV139_18615 [Parahaliea maris]|uniref:Uncharacterized protein n=1 Tax=Parahaliea maris TaxID=2716870 RepID=A0A5C8ZSD3_9GAMM|nr:FGGY family carbohydrate kinase [Parahaliea maris]TXS90271.1 hypothetical protein FV139_18615 [Parahaliea maris]
MSFTFILDIGKTNIKGLVLDAGGVTCWSRSRDNTVLAAGLYPHFDVESIWEWLLETLAEAAVDHTIASINVSTHGACAVLLDEHGTLALPVMDYESTLPEACSASYNAARPAFTDSLSPSLPAGLNLGRQLWWQREHFPGEFARVTTLLCYPQYWVWRLCGRAVSECTSLGCHTDLWLPREGRYSALVDALDLRDSLPPLTRAYEPAGVISPEVATATGVVPTCRVFAGVHDSNASFARYLAASASLGEAFTVVSTGTWFVSMAREGDYEALTEERDTLANVDVFGQPLACARFMGGREFEAICTRVDAGHETEVSIEALGAIIESAVYALPAFAAAGPFNGRVGQFSASVSNGAALATLYLALMVDYELDLLGARGAVIFGSLGQRNPWLCALVAALRPQQRVLISGDSASTARGAWCLTRWGEPLPPDMTQFTAVEPIGLAGLGGYRDQWRAQVGMEPTAYPVT